MASSTSAAHQVVVITGASSGIGAGIAQVLAATKKYQLVLIARRTDLLKEVADKAASAGAGAQNVLAITADVTQQAAVNDAFKQALAKFGKIDVWINNVGKAIEATAATTTAEQLRDIVEVNVLSAVYGIQAVLPYFQENNRGGQIINVSSVLGRAAPVFPTVGIYSGSKYFLNGITEALRAELKAKHPNITITIVAPGVTVTDMGAGFAEGLDPAQVQSVEQVGEAVLKLAIEQRLEEVYPNPIHKDAVRGYLGGIVPQ